MRFHHCLILLVAVLSAPAASAPKIVAPKAGIEIPQAIDNELWRGIKAAETRSAQLRKKLNGKPNLLRFMPDVDVFHVSVKRTLEDRIFFRTREFDIAKKLLQHGAERAQQLAAGKAPWNSATGLVVRAYISRIDDSLQPYGLWVSPGYRKDENHRRLDIWYHGRNDKLSEVAFLDRRLNRPAPFSPKNSIVLYPYGRFCNAMKFAGETDTWEALEHVRQFYDIDGNRVSVRGFSMGGAAAWHFGAHHASSWAAVNPGAGFVDTKIYQGLTDQLDQFPSYEKQLWRLYDSLDYAINLENTGLVAYSGEVDKQKAAADLMESALKKSGIRMTHIIGPKTGHKYEKGARDTVEQLVDRTVASGRNLIPKKIRFTTYTLKYNRMHWLTIDALDQHWERAEVTAELTSEGITATTRNVGAITFAPMNLRTTRPQIKIDGQIVASPRVTALAGWSVSLQKVKDKWTPAKPLSGVRKQHGLQGPIDDAFMDSFVMVPPSGKGWHPNVDRWIGDELADSQFQWRRQFRGNARVKSVEDIDANDIANSHLVLWGDPASNPLIERLLPFLPIKWTSKSLTIAGKKHEGAKQVPAMIFPNPLNPKKYVVLNSGFTFAHWSAMSNSRQTPKLPDWAVLDIGVSAADRKLGHGVSAAGFFNEQWGIR